MEKTLLEEAKEAYKDFGIAEHRRREELAQQRLINLMRNEIIRLAKEGAKSVTLNIMDNDIPYINFMVSWLEDNGLTAHDRNNKSNVYISVSGWAKE